MRQRSVNGLALFTLFLLATVLVRAQSEGSVAVHEISVGEDMPQAQYVYATPSTLDLIATQPGAHPGKIWIRSGEDGLHIWGKVQVEDNGLHWPKEKSEVLANDHVEVWLAASTDVSMPPVGWGNQFEKNELGGIKDCGVKTEFRGEDPVFVRNCERWYNEQLPYRRDFERLFVRQWLVFEHEYKPEATESFATAAYAGLKAGFFENELPTALEPKNRDGVVLNIAEDFRQDTKLNERQVINGYTFEMLIPYDAFPPVQQLDLRDLRLMVDVFSPAPEGEKTGPFSTTSPARKWGDPATFNRLRLDVPRSHSISPCGAKPEEVVDLHGGAYPAWFFPLPGKNPLYLSTDFAIQNPAAGYLYDPGGVSPGFVQHDHFWKQLRGGAYVCGPGLTYRKGTVTIPTKFFVGGQYFDAKALPDGWSLVRSGPDLSTYSPFGSGQCGSCPVVDFDIYAVSPAGEITQTLGLYDELRGREGHPGEADLSISPDWRRITYYRGFDPNGDAPADAKPSWTATGYCLEGHAYKECGKTQHAKPPDPPNFKDLRQDLRQDE